MQAAQKLILRFPVHKGEECRWGIVFVGGNMRCVGVGERFSANDPERWLRIEKVEMECEMLRETVKGNGASLSFIP